MSTLKQTKTIAAMVAGGYEGCIVKGKLDAVEVREGRGRFSKTCDDVK